ncbi:MaoC family dehydratase [Shewanella sp. SG41-3]|uniref:MaoC family dehydratase n=1 Tax=Shewanella sp. SG41-3 TaxID=2760977 RepID=UPI001601CE9F|nr:MaoC family dehydratase [Shewanella sp. SG41-3]MBB1474344.1 MaoC family dehydratase [Shewanella sp. SG41-3]
MYDIDDLEVGMFASYSQTISEADIKSFAGISGDRNPVHLDSEYAEKSMFKKRIAHGMISSSFFSALFGTKLPGEGCVYVSQSLKFRKPVYIDDTVVATVMVERIEKEKRRVYFNTYCKVGKQKVITGQAEIYIPEKK